MFCLCSVPGFFEQRRIADCLTSLDDVIVAQTQKLDRPQDPQKGADGAVVPSDGEGGGMSGKPKIYHFPNMRKLASRLRDDLTSGRQDFVMLYAYNGTGKTRLSHGVQGSRQTQ